jgi:hypothetical protein
MSSSSSVLGVATRRSLASNLSESDFGIYSEIFQNWLIRPLSGGGRSLLGFVFTDCFADLCAASFAGFEIVHELPAAFVASAFGGEAGAAPSLQCLDLWFASIAVSLTIGRLAASNAVTFLGLTFLPAPLARQ